MNDDEMQDFDSADDVGVDDAAVDNAELDSAGLDDAGLDDAGLDDAGLDDAGLDDAGLDDAGLDDAGLDDAAGDGDLAADGDQEYVCVPSGWAPPESTGVDAVDGAVAVLTDLDALPTAEHVARYEVVHRQLQDALADLDGS